MFSPIGSKATVAAFAPLGLEIITGHESGKVALFDAEDGSEIETNEKAHLGQVTDLQLSPDGTYFVTASKDQTAKVSRRRGLLPDLPMNAMLMFDYKHRIVTASRLQEPSSHQDLCIRNPSQQRCHHPLEALRHRRRWSGCAKRNDDIRSKR